MLVLSGEDREPGIKLGHDATQTPHVDGHMVVHAQNDFRRSIKPALYVGVDLLVLEAATTKVNDLDGALGRMPEENVFGLQVTVNNTMMPHQRE